MVNLAEIGPSLQAVANGAKYYWLHYTVLQVNKPKAYSRLLINRSGVSPKGLLVDIVIYKDDKL